MAKALRPYLPYLLVVCIACIGGILWLVRQPDHPRCVGCNVMVISLDQVRANSLPCFGFSQDTMPNLCRFSEQSAVFSRAYATASRTLDSHFSIMTSLYPSVHGMNLPYASVLSKQVKTLAERLHEEGYRTYFLGPRDDPHLPLTNGLGRGFDATYEADDPRSWIATLDAVASASAENNAPSFFFLHTYDAHEPYIPSEDSFRKFYNGPHNIYVSHEMLCEHTYSKLIKLHPERFPQTYGLTKNSCDLLDAYRKDPADMLGSFDDAYTIFNSKYWSLFDPLPLEERKQYVHALYAATLFTLDERLNDFFDYLGRRNMFRNTIIIIVGDQGDEFWEHNDVSHGWSLYNEVLHVPFIVYVPNERPKTYDKIASLVDIPPTIFGLLGHRIADTIAGIDLFSSQTHRAVYAEHVSDNAFAISTDTYKLIQRNEEEGPQVELYDLSHDPEEKQNIAQSDAATVARLVKEYLIFKYSFPSYDNTPNSLPTWIDEKDKKELIKRGYF